MKLSLEVKEQARTASFAVPAFIFMAAMFALPLFAILSQSLQNEERSFTWQAYAKIFSTPLFSKVALVTLQISLGATIFAILLAYPIAYFLSKQPPGRRSLYMILVLVPFWTSVLVKSFAFTVLLGQSGVVNQLLGEIGLGPYKMLFNRVGVMIGMSHFLVPFMTLPILTSILKQPPELSRAAAILGAGKFRIFWRVTLPLSLPGVISGCLLVFILSLGFYVVPALLGGRQDMMFANLVDFYTRDALDWQMASAVAVLLTAAAVAAAMGLSKVPGGSSVLAGEDH